MAESDSGSEYQYYSKYQSFDHFCQIHNDEELKELLRARHLLYREFSSLPNPNQELYLKLLEDSNNLILNDTTGGKFKLYNDYVSLFPPDHQEAMLQKYWTNGTAGAERDNMIYAYLDLIEFSPKDRMCLHHNNMTEWLALGDSTADPNPNLPTNLQTTNLLPSHLTESSSESSTLLSSSTTDKDNSARLKCPRFPDDQYCWPVAFANQTVYLPCIFNQNTRTDIIEHILNSDHSNRPITDYSASKHCNLEGRWEKTDYKYCNLLGQGQTEGAAASVADPAFVKIVNWGQIIVYSLSSVSLISCLVSLFIYQYFKNLQCTRVTIHVHLIASYILYHTVGIIENYLATVEIPGGSAYGSEEYTESNQLTLCDLSAVLHQPKFVFCKASKMLFWYTQLANNAWMFCEALFLRYQILANVFSDSMNLTQFYLIGWLTPVVLVMPFFSITLMESINFKVQAQNELLNGTITTVEYFDTMKQFSCLNQSTRYNMFFIQYPILICLFINMVILIVIIKTVVSKLRANTDKFAMKALKATCLLMPLLGAVQFATLYNPWHGEENIYDGLWYILKIAGRNLQGLLVCICYCFTNSEVQRVLKRQWGAQFSQMKPSKSVHSTFSRSYTERSTQNTEVESISMIPGPRSPSTVSNSKFNTGSIYSNRLGNKTESSYKRPLTANPHLKKSSVTNSQSQPAGYRSESSISYKTQNPEKEKFLTKEEHSKLHVVEEKSEITGAKSSDYETTTNRKVSQSDSANSKDRNPEVKTSAKTSKGSPGSELEK